MSRKVAVLIIGSLLLAACSSGGRSVAKSAYCSNKAEPLMLGDEKLYKRKTELKPDEKLSSDPADFGYASSQVYYHDQINGIKFMLENTRDSRGVVKTKVACIGGEGLSPKTQPFTVEIPVITDIKTDGQTSLIRSRLFKASFRRPQNKEAWFQYSSEPLLVEFTEAQLLDFYSEYPEATMYFTHLNNKKRLEYQLISHLKLTQTDDKTGRETKSVVVRSLVNFRSITENERKDRDEKDRKNLEPEEPTRP